MSLFGDAMANSVSESSVTTLIFYGIKKEFAERRLLRIGASEARHCEAGALMRQPTSPSIGGPYAGDEAPPDEDYKPTTRKGRERLSGKGRGGGCVPGTKPEARTKG